MSSVRAVIPTKPIRPSVRSFCASWKTLASSKNVRWSCSSDKGGNDMLLKLLLPYFTRAVSGGLVVHWHKAEGDSVEYGDDLFDMKVEEVKGIRNPMGSKEMIQVMTGPRVAERMLRAEEWMAQGFNPPESAYHITPADILLRV